MDKRIAHVVVGLPIEGHFDYSVEKDLQDQIAIGQRVLVPFHARRCIGCVVGVSSKTRFKRIKPILKILDQQPALSSSLLDLTKQFSEYYGCSWGEAIETSLPTGLRKGKALEISFSPVLKVAASDKPETILLHDMNTEKRWDFINEQIDGAIIKNKGVIFLVPEVSLIDDVVLRIKEYFDAPVAVLDKKLKAKEELEQWIMLKTGQVNIVVGTRSAIFAPVTNLGLIVIYDEESTSYKQEQKPFYHVRDVAFMRSKNEKNNVLLVSSAPSAETWYMAQKGKIKKISGEPSELSKVQMIDMSNYNPRRSSIISFPLRNFMETVVKERGCIVLFLNRRGFSSLAQCNQCGHTMKCKRCDVNMTYSFSKKKLTCRLCSSMADLPSVCPKCKSSYIRYLGIGIEKLESEIARIFPQARISRFDKETARIPKESNIIIATQAILKVFDKLSIDLMAVLQFDAELHRLDFRSAQKAFSLLCRLRQAARDKLVVQTYNTDSYCLKAFVKSDFKKFYQNELKFRKDLGFPPYKHLVNVCLRGASEEKVLAESEVLYELLKKKMPANIEVLPSHPDVLPKLRDKYRFTIMLKGLSVPKMISLIKKALKEHKKRDIIITINVDP